MPLFQFHGWRPDGINAFVDAVDLPDATAAREAAARMLLEHRSCVRITIYDEADRELADVRREGGGSLDGPVYAAAALPSWLSPEISVIATRRTGAVVYWGGAAAALYGWTAAEALGRDILELTPALQSRAQAADVMQILQAGGAWQGEITLRGRDGVPFRAFVANFPLGDLRSDAGLIVGVSVRADQRRLVDRRIDQIPAALAAAFTAKSAPRA